MCAVNTRAHISTNAITSRSIMNADPPAHVDKGVSLFNH